MLHSDTWNWLLNVESYYSQHSRIYRAFRERHCPPSLLYLLTWHLWMSCSYRSIHSTIQQSHLHDTLKSISPSRSPLLEDAQTKRRYDQLMIVTLGCPQNGFNERSQDRIGPGSRDEKRITWPNAQGGKTTKRKISHYKEGRNKIAGLKDNGGTWMLLGTMWKGNEETSLCEEERESGMAGLIESRRNRFWKSFGHCCHRT